LRFRRLVDATDPHRDTAAGAAPETADAGPEAAEMVPETAQTAPAKAEGEDAPAAPNESRSARRRREVIRSIVIVAIVALAALVLRYFVVGHYYIPSASMEPTLHGCPGCNDDHVLVDKVSYRAHPPDPGDIVVFDRPPEDPSGEDQLIKRVIGVGGDTVDLRDGHVYVNRLLLDEPYVNKRCGSRSTVPLTGVKHWKVPRGDVFVLGDNRCNSFDSRAFGPIRDSSIVGRAFAIIWPLKRVRLL
jgi:signal peptidase I